MNFTQKTSICMIVDGASMFLWYSFWVGLDSSKKKGNTHCVSVCVSVFKCGSRLACHHYRVVTIQGLGLTRNLCLFAWLDPVSRVSKHPHTSLHPECHQSMLYVQQSMDLGLSVYQKGSACCTLLAVPSCRHQQLPICDYVRSSKP